MNERGRSPGQVRQFLLPDLGEGLEDAEVVAWRVAEGDAVQLNQALAEVNTAKALVEIPAPWEGTVVKLHAAEGDVVNVGAPLVSIQLGEVTAPGAAGTAETAADIRPKRRAVLVGYGVEEEEEAERSAALRAGRRAADVEGRRGPVPASPPVRRLAKELGIDLAAVAGTGPGGRVTRDDVMRSLAEPSGRRDVRPAHDEPKPPGAPGTSAGARGRPHGPEIISVRGTRRLIAEKMARSVREIPHVTTFLTIDATHVQGLRREIEAETGQRVTPLPIIVRALVEVCRQFPKLNSTFVADRSEIVLHSDCHVGIATDTDRGLLVTVVRDAVDKGIVEISREIARLAEAARAGTARPGEVSGSTISVTNVGSFGAESGTPIINHPEAAILAIGVIEPRALVIDGRVEPRPATTLALSFDHRVLDGAEAGRAMRALGDLLQSPFKLGALPR